MALTPETLTRHELNGLQVEVVDASNPDLVGIAGRVVVETMQTLHLDDGSRVRQVPKRGTTFVVELGEPRLPDGRGGESRDECESADADDEGDASATETDEAAGGREAPGTASELPSDTAGEESSTRRPRAGQSGGCEGVAYVTVDGTRLLSRPARRTENAGDTTWR